MLDANPLDDLCALRNVEQVYMAGKPVKYKAKHLPKIDAELDGIMNGLDNDPFVSEWNIAEEKKSLNPLRETRHERIRTQRRRESARSFLRNALQGIKQARRPSTACPNVTEKHARQPPFRVYEPETAAQYA